MSYATNRKASYDYEILDTIEAGLVLKGFETKAIKAGKASIKGAYVKIMSGELWLIGATVSPYQPGNTPKDYDQQRSRKLLVTKTQLKHLIGKTEEKGITLVPTKLYGTRGLVKLEIGIARGKKKYDKREKIKEKEFKRRKDRVVKQY
ncbi:MAG: SsrA-binding protein SmpB [Parcubacteria group bacterium]